MMSRTGYVACVAAAMLCGSLQGVAQAGDRGSMEDQLACTPDVYRLCASFVPDETAITACLQQHVQMLSPACHKVFTRPSSPQDDPNNED